MQTAENKTKAEITAILQRHIYEGNIKHHIEPFTGKYIVADKIICEHRLVVAPNGKAADELQAIMPDVLVGCGGDVGFAYAFDILGKNIKLHTYGGTQWQK